MLGVSNEVMIASGSNLFHKIITSATALLTSRGIKNRVINLRHERNSGVGMFNFQWSLHKAIPK